MSEVKKSKMSSFQKKITFFGSGGPFLDGYVLVIIGLVLIQLVPQWNLTDSETGMLGAATLLGVLVGGPAGGFITDRVGREKMYVIDIITIIILSIMQYFVGSIIQLVTLRFFIGLAIGADYPIASTLVTEFSTRDHRGFMVGLLNCIWYVGAVAASIVGYFLLQFPEGWRWMLCSAAVPGVILLLGRLGTPESPIWLANKGRKVEARAVLDKVFPNMDISEFLEELEVPPVKTDYKKLLQPIYLKRIIYCGGFYAGYTIPVFAIGTFGPQIFEALGLVGDLWIVAYIMSNLFFVIGCIPALWLIDSWGRRPLNIRCFTVMMIGMLILAIFNDYGLFFVAIGFIMFCLAQGGPAVECWIVPNEVFPTELRSLGTGLGTAGSRIGAAIGTYLVPSMLSGIGVGGTMFAMAGVCLAAVILCIALAEETKGKTLAESSAA